MALNISVLMGRLVANPSLKSTDNGIEVCHFTIAVDRKSTKKGEEKQADFIDCIAWRQSAVFIDKYFRKGSMIAVTGYIQTRMYEDKNGNKRKAVEIVVEQASFCGGKSNSTLTSPDEMAHNSNINIPTNDSDFEEISDEDLPF